MAPDVIDAKLWSEQVADIVAFAEGDVLVAHNAGFDMGVITAACTASFIATPEYQYLCSLQVARKTYTLDSYRLPVAAMAAGFEDFKHHDAIADAEACAAIVAHAGRRHDARDVFELAELVSIRVGRIGKPAPGDSRRPRPACRWCSRRRRPPRTSRMPCAGRSRCAVSDLVGLDTRALAARYSTGRGQPFCGKPRLIPPWLGSSQRLVIAFWRVKKWMASGRTPSCRRTASPSSHRTRSSRPAPGSAR